MKKIKILYWVFTGLFAVYMFMTALPDALHTREAVDLIHDKLGYPEYIISFIGIVKLLGSVAIVLPLNIRLKDWAYAGLMFDLVTATYSLMRYEPNLATVIFMGLPMVVGAISYYYLYKLSGLNGAENLAQG